MFAVVVPSIILHELAHGVDRPGVRRRHRQTGRAAHPQSHPPRGSLGTLVLPGRAGPGRPRRVRLRQAGADQPGPDAHPRNDSLVVSLAGPATNLALAGLSVVLLRLARPAGTAQVVAFVVSTFGINSLDLTDRVLYLLGFVNVTLAVFNALPIPPLDGSAVVARLLPPSALPAWYSFQRYAMPVLLVLVLLDPRNFLGHVSDPPSGPGPGSCRVDAPTLGKRTDLAIRPPTATKVCPPRSQIRRRDGQTSP